MGAVFGEPSGAASVAGVKRAIADGVIKKSDSVSAVITGDGLKDIKAAIETAGTPMNTFALTNSGLTGPVYFLIYGYKVGARRALGGSTTKTSRAA
jgi:threonine synthase